MQRRLTDIGFYIIFDTWNSSIKCYLT